MSNKSNQCVLQFIEGTISAGEALKEILKNEHWKDSHSSFDLFCRETFNISEARARIMIHDADVLKKDPSKAMEIMGIQYNRN